MATAMTASGIDTLCRTNAMIPFPMLKQVVGCWASMIGEKSTMVTLLRWKSLAQRDEICDSLHSNKTYQDFLSSIAHLSRRQQSKLLNPTPFSPWN